MSPKSMPSSMPGPQGNIRPRFFNDAFGVDARIGKGKQSVTGDGKRASSIGGGATPTFVGWSMPYDQQQHQLFQQQQQQQQYHHHYQMQTVGRDSAIDLSETDKFGVRASSSTSFSSAVCSSSSSKSASSSTTTKHDTLSTFQSQQYPYSQLDPTGYYQPHEYQYQYQHHQRQQTSSLPIIMDAGRPRKQQRKVHTKSHHHQYNHTSQLVSTTADDSNMIPDTTTAITTSNFPNPILIITDSLTPPGSPTLNNTIPSTGLNIPPRQQSSTTASSTGGLEAPNTTTAAGQLTPSPSPSPNGSPMLASLVGDGVLSIHGDNTATLGNGNGSGLGLVRGKVNGCKGSSISEFLMAAGAGGCGGGSGGDSNGVDKNDTQSHSQQQQHQHQRQHQHQQLHSIIIPGPAISCSTSVLGGGGSGSGSNSIRRPSQGGDPVSASSSCSVSSSLVGWVGEEMDRNDGEGMFVMRVEGDGGGNSEGGRD
ncbi:hypothetical protein HDU76_013195 [Blyttiomyces sp. JEL0837]|nr:hypothetical protein HDU76_013195 [Blyttiomyces sp. JEL0837]